MDRFVQRDPASAWKIKSTASLSAAASVSRIPRARIDTKKKPMTKDNNPERKPLSGMQLSQTSGIKPTKKLPHASLYKRMMPTTTIMPIEQKQLVQEDDVSCNSNDSAFSSGSSNKDNEEQQSNSILQMRPRKTIHSVDESIVCAWKPLRRSLMPINNDQG